MNDERIEKIVRGKCEEWRKEAMDSVPHAYADRNLHGKYLRLDVATLRRERDAEKAKVTK